MSRTSYAMRARHRRRPRPAPPPNPFARMIAALDGMNEGLRRLGLQMNEWQKNLAAAILANPPGTRFVVPIPTRRPVFPQFPQFADQFRRERLGIRPELVAVDEIQQLTKGTE